MKRILALVLFFMTAITTAYAQQTPGVGQVAENVMVPVSILSNFIFVACYIVGGSFLFASIIKFIEHRRNPLMVPLSTVVYLIITGAILILLPIISLLSGSSFQATQ